MSEFRLFAVLIAAFVFIVVIEMLRRRKLREKYAAMWLFVSLGVVSLGVIPGLPTMLSDLVGFQLAANFVLASAAFVLLFVVLQLSSEVGHLEEEVRTTVEEIALLRCELEDVRAKLDERVTHAEEQLLRGRS
ncbi:hypothetical protein SAMN05216188_10136 [Lentzea xinjiangensis]|uniref:DUF2304 domain-containing protein n=1 Tax=Lentzea xinjiangensis TaxID=402600 RepID=A0A1H8ZHE9_9PSEU|nr:DUF2304 domain-containing protein [Lentzea xinjiangensis]SEP63842.1 hypothetical protein SAMN05216188_10136 [Lentzea xinjiangensis]